MAAQLESTELPVDKSATVTADAAGSTEPTGTSTAEEADQAEQPVPIPPVTIHLPSPSHSRTLPKTSSPKEVFHTLQLVTQPHESVQELKLAINEWVGGYWLGPYSLRIPGGKAGANGHTDGEAEKGEGNVLLSKAKEGIEVRAGEKLSEWLEIGDVFSHVKEGEERVLEVVREPYSDFSARQTVLRLLELIAPAGTSANTTSAPFGIIPGSTIFETVRDGLATSSSEPIYQEVEVSVPSGRKGKAGKKEVIKVKKEVASDTTNPFADWKAEWQSTDLSRIPISCPIVDVQPSLKAIQLSPFNPPPPHLRQQGHQLYLQVSLLEGDTVTLICTSRGWYVSKSNVNTFDPSPRSSQDGTPSQPLHSLIDLLHSLSPQFSERLALLAPLSTEPPPFEPISTVPIPQSEPAYPFVAPLPKPAATSDILRTQLAYLHTGATTADALDSARDWNEEMQGIKELPREGMQERVMREKMAQKTWAEFNQASIRAVLTIARGDVPPLNSNETPRCHMWLLSNIFVTRAIDCIDIYSHIGGDAAAWVSHAKDAAGVRLLNKVDVDGVHLLGHTVIDWGGERWVCQSMLPGIFSRRVGDDEVEEEESKALKEINGEEEKEKEDWVKVSDSPTKSIKSDSSTKEDEVAIVKDDKEEELPENPLIIYGVDSERSSVLHWDSTTHKVMARIASAFKLASHKVKDGEGVEREFYASSEVKALRGTDGRRYLLDLPRLMPVDIEWLEKDYNGKLAGPEQDLSGAKYPHRMTLLRPELVEQFWESELKRWARQFAAQQQEKLEKEKDKPGESSTAANKTEGINAESGEGDLDAQEVEGSPAAEAAAAQKAESDKPVDASSIGESIKQFDLRFNPDAFVDQAPKKGSEDMTAYVPSQNTDESDPSIKAVRDASVYLRSIAVPALTLDVMMGNTSGIMDGASLSKVMHQRGINIRYLGHIAASIASFDKGQDGQERKEQGHLAAFRSIVHTEMVFRAGKYILRNLIRGLAPEHVPCAVSHFLDCLLGTGITPEPKAVYNSFGLSERSEPAYTCLTPESLRKQIVAEVEQRYRWRLDESFIQGGLRKKQLLREFASRFAFQLVQRDYVFEASAEKLEVAVSEDDKDVKSNGKEGKKDKKDKKAKSVSTARATTFEPSDILTMIPVVRSTAPSASVPEEIMEAGRSTINRGNMDMGLELMLEAVQFYETIHSIIHSEVASAYNQYSSTLYQLARVKIQQLSAESTDAEQPLGLDIATGIRLQRQAVIIAERTIGIYTPETAAYYFNLAMLENLEGNAQLSLRYFRHVLMLWDVVYGPNHPEINTILSNAGVVLQAINENALSLNLLSQVQSSAAATFGSDHISNGHALHQLTQAYFLSGDIPKALESSVSAFEIFKARIGEENPQTKEVGKNVELLKAVVENVERQKAATQQAKERQLERLHAAQARVAATTRRRLNVGPGAPNVGAAIPGSSAAAATAAADADAEAEVQAASRTGERGHLDVDELVKFIQGQGQGGATGGQGVKRGKNALRGKRRTGAKR